MGRGFGGTNQFKLSIMNKKEEAFRKWNIEFNAMVYLKKPKFDKMPKSQKDKALKLLSEFEQFLNQQ